MDSARAQDLSVRFKGLIPSEKIFEFRDLLLKADDSAYDRLNLIPTYDPTVVLLCSIFVGGLGVDRFIIGDIGLGVCKLLFGWATFGIWPLVDIFFSYRKAKEKITKISFTRCKKI
jgi:hypothetical protein